MKLFKAIAPPYLLLVAWAMVFGVGFQEGTAASCNNYPSTVHKCMCDRAMMCGKDGHPVAEPGKMCSTYCRPNACKCSTVACATRK